MNTWSPRRRYSRTLMAAQIRRPTVPVGHRRVEDEVRCCAASMWGEDESERRGDAWCSASQHLPAPPSTSQHLPAPPSTSQHLPARPSAPQRHRTSQHLPVRPSAPTCLASPATAWLAAHQPEHGWLHIRHSPGWLSTSHGLSTSHSLAVHRPQPGWLSTSHSLSATDPQPSVGRRHEAEPLKLI